MSGAVPTAVRDPHQHDAEVAASVFADSFEGGHTAPTASSASTAEHTGSPRITLPPTAGEPGEPAASAASASGHDAELAALVKPAPNTIARGAASSTAPAPSDAAPAADEKPEHG
jgi:hypothetical protein